MEIHRGGQFDCPRGCGLETLREKKKKNHSNAWIWNSFSPARNHQSPGGQISCNYRRYCFPRGGKKKGGGYCGCIKHAWGALLFHSRIFAWKLYERSRRSSVGTFFFFENRTVKIFWWNSCGAFTEMKRKRSVDRTLTARRKAFLSVTPKARHASLTSADTVGFFKG